jgi:peroxiredoxin
VSESDLDKAADAVGFQVTTGADIGVIENLPAETTLLPPSRTLLPVGAVAPDFTLRTPEGAAVRLADYRGKVVLLEFFATWCPHCQAEAPHLLAMYQSMPTSRIAFLAVNGDSEDAASVHAFGRHFGLPWPELLDPGSPPGSFSQQGGIGPVSRAYGLSLFPTFYIIDAKGRIAWRGDREQPDGLLRARLLDASGS